MRVYAGGKFGFVGFENDTNAAYGAIAVAEYNINPQNKSNIYFGGKEKEKMRGEEEKKR